MAEFNNVDHFITEVSGLSELELKAFLEGIHEILYKRNQEHLIIQCFSYDFDEQIEMADDYERALMQIRDCLITTNTVDKDSLYNFYKDVENELSRVI